MAPADDYRAARERMKADIQKLALESPDHRVRLAASKMLHDIAAEREQRAGHRTINVEALANELTAMQSGAAAAPIQLEVVNEIKDSDTP
jgi:hypothetical protein